MDLVHLFPDLHANDLDTLSKALYDQTRAIKRQFSSLILHLKKDLDNMALSDIQLFENIIVFLGCNLETELNDCTSSSDVFEKLNRFVSFFDYDIAEDLIREFGSDAMNDELQQYRSSFEEFAKRRVRECPVNAFGEPESPEEVLVIKTDKLIERLTVDELRRLKYKIQKALGILMRVLRVEKGCVKITFRLLNQEYLKQEFFRFDNEVQKHALCQLVWKVLALDHGVSQ